MKRYWNYIVVIFLLLLNTAVWAQEEEEEDDEPLPLKERLYYTGGLDLQLGNATVIGLYPVVGYKFNEVLSAGVGLSYRYTKYNAGTYLINGLPYSVAGSEPQHTYGGKVFGRALTPIRAFVHGEWETINAFIPGFSLSREWFSALLVGGGYSMLMGNGRASMNVMMLYNLNRSANEAIYRSEFVPRVEFAYNF